MADSEVTPEPEETEEVQPESETEEQPEEPMMAGTDSPDALIVSAVCPSYMCSTVGAVNFINVGNSEYVCPRCEQKSTIASGVATHTAGMHA